MKERQLYLFRGKSDGNNPHPRNKVVFSLDVLFLLSVVIILLCTFSFSLGVERGKRVALQHLRVEEVRVGAALKQEVPVSTPGPADSAVESKPVAEPQGEMTKKYRIQVASFRKRESALRETERLKKKGYPVLVDKKGNYHVVYVGGFSDKNEAKANYRALKEIYRDCRLREGL